MSFVEHDTPIVSEVTCERGLAKGTLVIRIDRAKVFLDNEGMDTLRDFIRREIEKGWFE